MKVKDLVDKLSKLDPDSLIIIRGYEGGYNSLSSVNEQEVVLNVNTKDWYGKHDDFSGGYSAESIKFDGTLHKKIKTYLIS